MEAILKIKNNIRSFLRRFDEIFRPIFKFVWCFLAIYSLQKLYNYSDLGGKSEVTVLLAVLSALLPDGFMFFMVGALLSLHCFNVSLEVGIIFLLLYIIMYTAYARFFPKLSYAMYMVPIFYMLGIPYAAPVAIGLIAGIGGAVPAVFGLLLYFYSICTSNMAQMIKLDDSEEGIETFKIVMEQFVNNKEMYGVIVVFVVTILIIGVLKMLQFPYSMYVALVSGIVANLLGAVVAGAIVHVTIDMGPIITGSIIGLLIGVVIRIGQGIVDYGKVERVKFEDDDYYYYVRAVPKVDAEKPKKKAKAIEAIEDDEDDFKPAPKPIVSSMITDDTPLDEPVTSLYNGPLEEKIDLPKPGEDSAFSPVEDVPSGDTQPFTVIKD